MATKHTREIEHIRDRAVDEYRRVEKHYLQRAKT